VLSVIGKEARQGDGPRPGRRRGAWGALADSFAVAWNGVVETALSQRNMRIHLVAGLLVALVASGLDLGIAEQLALLACVFLVLAAEVANSALESLVDLVTRERDDRARAAKDAGAGAVLVLAAGSVAVLAAVLVHAWPVVVSGRAAALRQAALGVPLAAVMGALLAPTPRPPALDGALAVTGSALLIVLAVFTTSPVFTMLAALLFVVAIAGARRRRAARDLPL
jgi:diacylglycerol kinase (ATP)